MSSPQGGATPPAPDPLEILRSRGYVALLVLAALIGVPIAAAAFFFLQLVTHLQSWVYTDLPEALGFSDPPIWWPVPLLVLAGALVGLTIRYLPGRGGECPAEGFHPHGAPLAREVPGIAIAAVVSLSLGAVVGPEAPLIALGGGLAVLALRLMKPDSPAQTATVVGAAGSFAAISTLLGSPLLGAFLLMEATPVGGVAASVVLVPGLLAAGIGALLFTGLGSLTGLGVPSLAIPGLPGFPHPDVVQFGWALAIGVAAAFVGTGIRRLALALQPRVERNLLLACPAAGLVIATLAMLYQAFTDKGFSDVLFSGQDDLPTLLATSSSYSVGALILLLVCKGLAYSVALSSFRGGPIFPAMFLGAAGGIALSHLPGLPMVAGVAMGIGGMSVAMLGLPMVSVLLATLLLASDGLAVMPLVIVTVVVAYVVTARLNPPPAEKKAAPVPAGQPTQRLKT
jgi:H+/Cl- antiporter ClcA